jgi:hypothetical protein
MTRNQFRALAVVAALLAVALVAMPALGVDPSGSPSTLPSTEPSATASTEPSQTASPEPSAAPSAAPSASSAAPPAPVASAEASEPDENGQGGNNGATPDKAAKPDKGSEAPEHPGGDDFTLVVGIKVYRLSDGPPWWWGDANPLAASVGKVVTIAGEQEEGSDEVDVLAIDGKTIREPGRPPWAGGWKVVGPKHPGWAQWKVDKQAKGTATPTRASRTSPHQPDAAPAAL